MRTKQMHRKHGAPSQREASPFVESRPTLKMPSRRPIPAPPPPLRAFAEDNPILYEALEITPSVRLVALLKVLCAHRREVAEAVADDLLVPIEEDDIGKGGAKDLTQRKGKVEDEEGLPPKKRRGPALEEVNGNEQPPKRKLRPCWALCAQCREKYDVTRNGDQECYYYSGEAEEDRDKDAGAWSCGIFEARSEEDWETWTCCGEDGPAEGCRVGPHREERLQCELDENDRRLDDDEGEDGDGDDEEREG